MTFFRIENSTLERYQWRHFHHLPLVGFCAGTVMSLFLGLFALIAVGCRRLTGAEPPAPAVEPWLSPWWGFLFLPVGFALWGLLDFLCTRLTTEIHWVEIGSQFVYRRWLRTRVVDWDKVDVIHLAYRIDRWDADESDAYGYELHSTLVVRFANGRSITLSRPWTDPYSRGQMAAVLLEQLGSDRETTRAALRALARLGPDTPPDWTRPPEDDEKHAADGERLAATANADVAATRAVLAEAVERITALAAEAEQDEAVRRAAAEAADRIRARLNPTDG